MLATIDGRYTWLNVPCLVATAGLFIASGARVGADASSRRIDIAIIAALSFIALQLAPMPSAALARLSPHATTLQNIYTLGSLDTWRPISIDPAETRNAFTLALTAAFVFWASREAFARGGNRAAIRALAVIGFACALVSLAQRATAPRTVLWRWQIADPRAVPFGPFVDRNHLATWLVMTITVVAGYCVMHVSAHMTSRARTGARAVAVAMSDGDSLFVAGCLGAMLMTLAATTSRSGAIALVVSAMTGASLSRNSGRYGVRIGLIAAGALLVIAAWLNFDALAERIVTTIAPVDLDDTNRIVIWRETLRIIRDFPLFGTGAGTFKEAMFIYQQTAREVLFNHAHNEYLQILTEGGITLLLIVLTGVTLIFHAAYTQLRADTGAHRFIRIAACAAIAGVAAQSLFEVGLRAPANLLLIAILSAIAVRPMDRTVELTVA